MKQTRLKLQIRRQFCSILFALILISICTVNTTYAWESLNQTAVNIAAGEKTTSDPPEEDPDKPSVPDTPNKPDIPDKPSDTEKPDKKPETTDKPKEPPKAPDSSLNQTGKADADTGDTHQFIRYMLLMLLSFVMLIIIGVTLIVSTINIVENRRT